MSSELIASHREKAEIVTGDAACKQKRRELLKKFSLPLGILPVTDMVEYGFDPSTGFTWAIQKNKMDHTFKEINLKTSFDTVVTAFMEERRLKKVTGVKAKELLIWVTVCEISIEDPASGKMKFRTPAGLTRNLPISAFEEKEEEKKS